MAEDDVHAEKHSSAMSQGRPLSNRRFVRKTSCEKTQAICKKVGILYPDLRKGDHASRLAFPVNCRASTLGFPQKVASLFPIHPQKVVPPSPVNPRERGIMRRNLAPPRTASTQLPEKRLRCSSGCCARAGAFRTIFACPFAAGWVKRSCASRASGYRARSFRARARFDKPT